MKHRFFPLLLAAAGFFWIATPAIAAEAPTVEIELPLEVHLVRDMEVSRRGVAMTNWITASDIQDAIMPEVNRIWRQAGITWKLSEVSETTLGDLPAKRDLTAAILSFGRDSNESFLQLARPARMVARQNGGAKPDRFHLFVVPYVGRSLQGFAMPKRQVSFLGVWTDKPSKGSDAPRRVKLTEPEPFFIGSLGRTASHELGHLLGLKHDSCSVQCLMGGTRSEGYLLSASQIATVREKAGTFLSKN